jgi:Ca2+-binding RTX toxin-like protein
MIMNYYERLGAGIVATRSKDSWVDLTYLPSGRFVMVWVDNDGGLGDANTAIRARLYEADGTPAGEEFRVNTTTQSVQQIPQVASLSSGGFVVVWDDFSGQGGDSGQSVKGQIFSANGAPLGGEFLVNTATASGQREQAVAGMPDGSFVVVWSDSSRVGGDASEWGVKAQRFDAAGGKLGGEFLVNTTTAGSQFKPVVSVQGDGSFLVAWVDYGLSSGSSSASEIRAQRFNADGSKSGGELLISSPYYWSETSPSLTSLAGGGYVVTWHGARNGQKVFAQRLDAAGEKVGEAITIPISAGNQYYPQAEGLSDGGFVLSWIGYVYDGLGRTVAARLAQAFNADGSMRGGTVTLSFGGDDVASLLVATPIAADGNGGFIAAWGAGGGIDALRITPGGGEVGDIELTTAPINEVLPEGQVIGKLWNAELASAPVSYTIEGDSSGGAFRVRGNLLVLDDISKIDFESASSVSVTVRGTAPNGSSTVETFQMDIRDSRFEERYGGGAELAVNSTAEGAQTGSTVTALTGGGFLVTWTDTRAVGGNSDVKGQLYDGAGGRLGGEFLVSSAAAPHQHNVLAAGLEGGGFVAVWFDGSNTSSSTTGDTSGGGVLAQRFDASGQRIGGEFLVNTATANSQVPTAIVALAGGGFAVAWTDNSLQGGDAASSGVKAQIFDAADARVGGEFLVNTNTAGAQSDAVLAALPGGGFVAAWTDASKAAGDTSGKAVRAQLFDAAGAKTGGEFLVNTSTGNDQWKPAVTVLASGRFVIAWEMAIGEGRDQDGTSIRAQMFGPDGSRIGGEVLVNETVRGDQQEPAVIALPNGGYLIAWQNESGDPWYPEINIIGQFFDADGAAVGGEFRLNADEGQDQVMASLAVLASGAFVASWTEEEYLFPAEVRARLFTPGGAPRTLGTDLGETVTGSAGDDIVYASGGNDLIRAEQGGDDRIHGGYGDDVIYMGAGFDADDRINGGGGNDTLVLQGNYGPIQLAAPLIEIDTLRLLSAGDGSFVSATRGAFSYAVTVQSSSLVAGSLLTVDASGLTAAETLTFTGPYDGGARVAVTGGKGADRLVGGPGADVLNGGDGNDYLWGRGGADLIDGGEGNDSISMDGTNFPGGTARGGNGDDELRSGPGGWVGLQSHYGDAGNDRLSFVSNVGDAAAELYMSGGEGNDSFEIAGQSPLTLTLDAGAGDDSVLFTRMLQGSARVTLGSGRDTLSFGPLDQLLKSFGALTVSDFETGAGGENLRLSAMLSGLGWTRDNNPFVAGHARLLQDGADTLLQIDLDGGANGFVTLVRFENRQVASFTPENLDGYVNGTGSAGRILTAASGVSGTWEGTNGNDSMTAGAGARLMYGRGGDDVLSGGDGNDQLYGESGNDVLDGGAGDDTIEDHNGNNTMRGGDGNDYISAAGAGNLVDGGLGNDTIHIYNYRGEPGGASSVDAGGGDDVVTVRITVPMAVTIDGGAGADRVEIVDLFGSATVTLGSGADSLILGHSVSWVLSTILPDTLVVTDFQAGAEGDRMAFDYYLARHLPNRPAGTNPFDTGHLRLVQAGGDTLIEITGTGGSYSTLVRLTGVNAAELKAANLGYAPGTVYGTAGDDTITGSAADDRIDGGSGADQMIGGLGNDLYVVDQSGDTVVELAGEGIDEVRTPLGSKTDFAQMYILPANVENLTGTSTTGQGVQGNALNNLITMGRGSDLVTLDTGGDDHVSGGGGNDYFYWGAAFNNADRADGGAGTDTLGLLGTYQIVFEADDLANIEKLALYSSGNPAAPNGYNLTMHDANLAGGQTMTVIAQSLSAIEVLAFNGAAELDGKFNIRGGKGADTITGGAGNDTIWGNLGADQLRGGKGDDLFDYNAVAESKSDAADTILDFARGDRINLARIDADGNAANGDSKFTYLGDGAFTGAAGELRVSQHPQHSRTWVVEADVNGDRIADLTIYLVGPPGFLPQAGDFIL